MRRRRPDLKLWLLLAGVAIGSLACTERQRPHVVLIVIDTLRADKLGSYGFDRETSPEIDALAADGVRFERVVAQSSWTRPSIGSLLTSLYPRTLGIYKEQDEILADAFLTLAEVLQDRGYRTFGITANPNINRSFNFHQGFDEYLDSTARFGWMKDEPDKPTVGQAGLTPARDVFRQVLERVRADAPAEPESPEASANAPSVPWYVQINVMDVHEHTRSKSLIRDEFRDLYPGAKHRNYLQTVRQVSVDVGEFVSAWRSIPGLQDTLFILTSDHGEGLGDHPHVSNSKEHGIVLYESNLRVPLVFYHPSKLTPRTVPQDVRLLDLMPTLLDYLDLRSPKGIQGTSLVPWLTGSRGRVDLPEVFVVETEFRRYHKIAVRSPAWKYIENRGEHPRMRPFEIQENDRREDGRWTHQRRAYREFGLPMRKYLADWEEQFPRQEPTLPGEQIPPEVRKQLEALGYLD